MFYNQQINKGSLMLHSCAGLILMHSSSIVCPKIFLHPAPDVYWLSHQSDVLLTLETKNG